MCEPTTAVALAGLALSSAAAGAKYKADQDAANATTSFQNKRYATISEAANANYQEFINSTATRDAEEVAAAAGQAMTARVAAEQAEGSAAVSAGARGVSGVSVDDLFTSFKRIDSLNQQAIGTNLAWRQRQLQETIRSARADAQGQIVSVAPQPIQGASLIELGLGLGTGALESYNTYSGLRERQRRNAGVA